MTYQIKAAMKITLPFKIVELISPKVSTMLSYSSPGTLVRSSKNFGMLYKTAKATIGMTRTLAGQECDTLQISKKGFDSKLIFSKFLVNQRKNMLY